MELLCLTTFLIRICQFWRRQATIKTWRFLVVSKTHHPQDSQGSPRYGIFCRHFVPCNGKLRREILKKRSTHLLSRLAVRLQNSYKVKCGMIIGDTTSKNFRNSTWKISWDSTTPFMTPILHLLHFFEENIPRHLQFTAKVDGSKFSTLCLLVILANAPRLKCFDFLFGAVKWKEVGLGAWVCVFLNAAPNCINYILHYDIYDSYDGWSYVKRCLERKPNTDDAYKMAYIFRRS